jgi:molybdate transport repressor ModE-like protein
VLDLRRLLVLREVARCGSLSGAARSLNYTQPAITHHIRRLEREVGTPLVSRAGRGVRLTEAGQALVAHADALAARLAAAEEQVGAIAGLRAGRVRLASFPTGTATLVPRALAELKRLHPGLTVSLVEAEPPGSLGLLRQGDCDVALSFAYPSMPAEEAADFVTVPLFAEDLLAVLPAAHPLAGVDALRLELLADATWIAGCDRCRGHLLHACASAGFSPQIAFATDDYVAVQQLVAAGLGVALLPRLAITTVLTGGVAVRPLASPRQREIAVVLPADARRPPAVSATLAALQRAAAELGWAG